MQNETMRANTKVRKAGKISETAFQRSKVYRLLAYSFQLPTEEFEEFLKRQEFVMEGMRALQAYPLRKESKRLVQALQGIRVVDFDLMRDEHIKLFTLQSKCPPYETEYSRTETPLFSSEGMADIAGFYRAFGLDFIKDRPDYLPTELEFMHLVTLREAEAIYKREIERVELCQSVERGFLREHLGKWVHAFAEAVLAEGSSFYYPISLLLRDWITAEGKYLKIGPYKLWGFRIEETEKENQIRSGGTL